ncbi:MAG: hypothetical protein ACYCW6_16345 [Candidatus Xenobia bacterium]
MPVPTLPPPTLVNFVTVANRGSASISEFAVVDTTTGALAAGNTIPLAANPAGEILDPGFTAPPGLGVPDRLGSLLVALSTGIVSFNYTAVSGSIQANQTTPIPPAGGGTLTGPLAFDPSRAFLFAATTAGIDVYQLAGPNVSQPAVSNAVKLTGVTSLATTTVGNAPILLATSPAGVTAFAISDSNAGAGTVLGVPVTQATLAVPNQVAAAGGFIAVAEAAAGGGTNGETFSLSATSAFSAEGTFTVGAGGACNAVTVANSTVFAANASGVVDAFPIVNGSLGTPGTASLGSLVTSLLLLSPALYVTTTGNQVVPLAVSGTTLSAQAPVATGSSPAAVQGSSAEVFAL